MASPDAMNYHKLWNLNSKPIVNYEVGCEPKYVFKVADPQN